MQLDESTLESELAYMKQWATRAARTAGVNVTSCEIEGGFIVIRIETRYEPKLTGNIALCLHECVGETGFMVIAARWNAMMDELWKLSAQRKRS